MATNDINISPNNEKEVVYSFLGKVADSLANSIRANMDIVGGLAFTV